MMFLIGAALWLGGTGAVHPQEPCKRKLDNSGARSSYTEQHAMDVGDVPGHQIRIFELHRVFESDQENCEGLKRTEQWNHGFSDYIDRNGRAWGYAVITFDNGDKIFAEYSGTSLTVIGGDGKPHSTYVGTTRYTGGTGLYRGVQGMARDKVIFDPVANINVAESEEEYWIAK